MADSVGGDTPLHKYDPLEGDIAPTLIHYTIPTILGMLATTTLAFVGKGNYFAAISLYILGVVGFSGGNVFYDSLLTVVVVILKSFGSMS